MEIGTEQATRANGNENETAIPQGRRYLSQNSNGLKSTQAKRDRGTVLRTEFLHLRVGMFPVSKHKTKSFKLYNLKLS